MVPCLNRSNSPSSLFLQKFQVLIREIFQPTNFNSTTFPEWLYQSEIISVILSRTIFFE